MTTFTVCKEAHHRVSIFVDVQNVFYAAYDRYGGRMRYANLISHIIAKRLLHTATAYVISSGKNQSGFVTCLTDYGFNVKSKVKGRGVRWDFGMAIDVINTMAKADVIALVTGDGDFADLACHVQQNGVNVEVYGFDDIQDPAFNYFVLPQELVFVRSDDEEEDEIDEEDFPEENR